MFYLLIGADLLMGLTFFYKFPTLPPQIPLLYSRGSGEDQLTDLWFIFLLPILMHILFFANNFLYRKMFLGNMVVKKILEYLNMALIIVITIIFIKILFLVG